MIEIAIIHYTENDEHKTKEVKLPHNCLGDHAKTCDFIDSVMGGNDKWDGYDIKE